MTTFIVFYGVRLTEQSCKVFYTEHHAEQFKRALELNGTPARIVEASTAL
jgi:hypothetical protein